MEITEAGRAGSETLHKIEGAEEWSSGRGGDGLAGHQQGRTKDQE